jgi:hypothetical protein
MREAAWLFGRLGGRARMKQLTRSSGRNSVAATAGIRGGAEAAAAGVPIQARRAMVLFDSPGHAGSAVARHSDHRRADARVQVAAAAVSR